ncbi:MAG: hypothetical protein GXX96_31080 [Planctomycetaceae bacterium]|nr:hypothetical protein [Planctomycetaceae bacterium]
MKRLLFLGLLGGLLGVVLGGVVVLAKTTSLFGSSGNQPAPNFGPVAYEPASVLLEPVAEVRILPDGRTYQVYKLIPEIRDPEEASARPWKGLVMALARQGNLDQAIDTFAAIPSDAERADTLLGVLPLLNLFVTVEQGAKWSEQPPPVPTDGEMRELIRTYLDGFDDGDAQMLTPPAAFIPAPKPETAPPNATSGSRFERSIGITRRPEVVLAHDRDAGLDEILVSQLPEGFANGPKANTEIETNRETVNGQVKDLPHHLDNRILDGGAFGNVSGFASDVRLFSDDIDPGRSETKNGLGDDVHASSNTHDENGKHFAVVVAQRSSEILQLLVDEARRIDEPVAKSHAMAGIASFQQASEEKWARLGRDATLATARDAGIAAQKHRWVWLWPIVLAIVGFLVTSLLAPLLEASGKIVAEQFASVIHSKELAMALRGNEEKLPRPAVERSSSTKQTT